jgi:hypothetical protein
MTEPLFLIFCGIGIGASGVALAVLGAIAALPIYEHRQPK